MCERRTKSIVAELDQLEADRDLWESLARALINPFWRLEAWLQKYDAPNDLQQLVRDGRPADYPKEDVLRFAEEKAEALWEDLEWSQKEEETDDA